MQQLQDGLRWLLECNIGKDITIPNALDIFMPARIAQKQITLILISRQTAKSTLAYAHQTYLDKHWANRIIASTCETHSFTVDRIGKVTSQKSQLYSASDRANLFGIFGKLKYRDCEFLLNCFLPTPLQLNTIPLRKLWINGV
jgi:hypothetical protein